MAKQKWDWRRWLDELERADIGIAAKKLGREIPATMKRSRRALVPWELPSAPSYGELTPLVLAGLLHQVPAVGQFVPIVDPMPAANSISTTPAERRVLRLLLKGHDLSHDGDGECRGTRGWLMRESILSFTRIPISTKAADRLLAAGLIEWNGCGNWPRFSVRHYSVSRRRLCGVRGFRTLSLNWIRERVEAATAA